MFNMRPSSWVILSQLVFFIGSTAEAKSIRYAFSEIEAELYTSSGGAIQVKNDLPDSAKETLFKKKKSVIFTDYQSSPLDPQDYFNLDVLKFNSLMEAPDFLTAKQNFYSALLFNKKTQRYSRP